MQRGHVSGCFAPFQRLLSGKPLGGLGSLLDSPRSARRYPKDGQDTLCLLGTD
jgi:hypothetical protein